MGVQPKYNPEFHIPWAWSLAIRGATDKEIAEEFGVSERTIYRWKYEYDEKITAANKVVAPQFTDEIRRYVGSYKVPREIAYAGGRAQYKCVIRSNGKVGNVQTLVSSVAAKASFDQTFLSNLPRFIPGTKGGQPVDMVVVFWLDWVPSRNLQMAQCSPAY